MKWICKWNGWLAGSWGSDCGFSIWKSGPDRYILCLDGLSVRLCNDLDEAKDHAKDLEGVIRRRCERAVEEAHGPQVKRVIVVPPMASVNGETICWSEEGALCYVVGRGRTPEGWADIWEKAKEWVKEVYR